MASMTQMAIEIFVLCAVLIAVGWQAREMWAEAEGVIYAEDSET